jgi:hypothetical protein
MASHEARIWNLERQMVLLLKSHLYVIEAILGNIAEGPEKEKMQQQLAELQAQVNAVS